VRLVDGTRLNARLLISATGQLSRPAWPKLAGLERFQGQVFHSAQWDHSCDLTGKRVAVIGTGASAIQFVPAIADRVASLAVFQRSPAYLLPRPDRPYPAWRQRLFRRWPWTARLHRLGIFLRYESRALAFTRFKGLMQFAVGRPFQRLLQRQVPDPQLRARLTPEYAIGCKRILLSSEYLLAMSKPQVELVTEGIAQITERGVQTRDGRRHAADVLIFGTGFAATEFLAPMRIVGRAGRDLNDAWRAGAKAWMGMAVPGFPNFFMLYGPNTNLGHNSIVYMLESQIGHVMQAYQALQRRQAASIEVDERQHQRFATRIQRRLAQSVWSGCQSWYTDAAGRNTTNWPGFALSYRWLACHGGLGAYRLSSIRAEDEVLLEPPPGWREAALAAFLRGFLRGTFRLLAGPPVGLGWQRRGVAALATLMPGAWQTLRYRSVLGGVSTEIVAARHGSGAGAIRYLHGGAFCLGSPATHRSVTTRLALASGATLFALDYRLAPEQPFPAALQDALAAYRALRAQGYPAERIVIAGDSAGGQLAIQLLLSLRYQGEGLPAGAALLSPFFEAESQAGPQRFDPMLRQSWLDQCLRAYRSTADASLRPERAQLAGLPPLFIQVGEQELLLDATLAFAHRARAAGVSCPVEIHRGRWHVFQLQASYLESSRRALQTLADFIQARLTVPLAESGSEAPLPLTRKDPEVAKA